MALTHAAFADSNDWQGTCVHCHQPTLRSHYSEWHKSEAEQNLDEGAQYTYSAEGVAQSYFPEYSGRTFSSLREIDEYLRKLVVSKRFTRLLGKEAGNFSWDLEVLNSFNNAPGGVTRMPVDDNHAVFEFSPDGLVESTVLHEFSHAVSGHIHGWMNDYFDNHGINFRTIEIRLVQAAIGAKAARALALFFLTMTALPLWTFPRRWG